MQQMLEPQMYRHGARLRDYAPRYAIDEAPARSPRRRISVGFKTLDNTADGPNSAYAHRVGTLFRLADLLTSEGALDTPTEDLKVQNRLQKCAYIAQQMGANVDYEFGFMRDGAFSTELAVDVYQRNMAGVGADPFAAVRGRLAGFLGLVSGHTTEWLQLATFAVRPAAARPSRAEFADRVAWSGSGYDRRRAVRVFDAVAALRTAEGDGQAA